MATSRFADLSEDEMEEFLNETESRNTKNVIQVASKLFEDYINNKLNLRSDKSNEEIVQILRKFYCNIRKRNVAQLKILELCNMLFDGAMSASYSQKYIWQTGMVYTENETNRKFHNFNG